MTFGISVVARDVGSWKDTNKNDEDDGGVSVHVHEEV